MRHAPNMQLEKWRVAGPPWTNCGAFFVRRNRQADLFLIVGNGGGWDHVSVTIRGAGNRCPTWEEMCIVKDLIFDRDEVVMQLHVAKSDNINDHPYCLHLWRPQTADEIAAVAQEWQAHGEEVLPYDPVGPIPLPPKYMVGKV